MKRLLSLSLFLVFFLSGGALAQNTQTTTATVNVQGVLELDAIVGTVDFGTHSPGDVANPASGTLVATFRDTTTGTTGYHLTLESADFTDGGTNTLAATNFEMEDNGALTITPAGGNTNTAPDIDPNLNIPTALDSAVRLLEADQSLGDATVGKGEWTLTIDNNAAFTLNIPVSTVPASYTATMTFSLNSGI